LKGDPALAEQLATDARDVGLASGHSDAATFFAPQLAMARWQQGRLAELVPETREVVARAPGMPVFIAVLALAYTEQGDGASAHDLLRQAAADRFVGLPRNQTWISTLACWSHVSIEVRDTQAADALFELLEPFRAQVCYDRPTFTGLVAHYLGGLAAVLGRHDVADAHYSAALSTALALGAKWARASTSLAWSRALLQRRGPGDVDRAAPLLADAVALSSENGYGTLERSSRAASAAL
jgi:hypothetical protein